MFKFLKMCLMIIVLFISSPANGYYCNHDRYISSEGEDYDVKTFAKDFTIEPDPFDEDKWRVEEDTPEDLGSSGGGGCFIEVISNEISNN